MKKLLLLALATLLTFSVANAEYSVTYGNADGTDLMVTLDSDNGYEIWIGMSVDQLDTINFLHMPVASDDLVVTGRNGGTFDPFYGGFWDDLSFLPAAPDDVLAGFTNQSAFGFAYLTDPRDDDHWVHHPGETRLFGTFDFHTANDPALLETTVCPFVEGANPQNGGLLFGASDGVTQYTSANMTVVYGCLYFTPNNDPVWTVNPATATGDAGLEVCFDLAGTDADALDDLHIVLVSAEGTFTETAGGPGGVAAGTFCGTFAAGSYVVSFELQDNAGGTIPWDVELTVGEIELEIACPNAFPGETVSVNVRLHTAAFLTGGFEILCGWDPTGLTLQSVEPTWRIDYGSEYFYVNMGDSGPGTARITWIADINNGVPNDPAPAGSAPIFRLTFMVDSAIPFGMNFPIDFIGSHYSDNTISDPSGYVLVWPLLTAGCINVTDPSDIKGDPNVNCYLYEVADAVLVARRLIFGWVVWGENTDNCYGVTPGTDDDDMQEAAADLNNNTFADVADLVQFINIINGMIAPPAKLDPAASEVAVTMPNAVDDNMMVSISSGLDVGAALVTINHSGVEVGAPIAADGMEVMSYDADGVLKVVVYSLEGNTIAAGNAALFTVPVTGEGTMTFDGVQVSDNYGRLLDASASLVAPLPEQFAVKGNYPNPFNAKTQINFDLPEASNVSVQIYSVTGQLVENISGQYEAGAHSINWDASDVSSGVYFYKVSAGSYSQTMKMTLLK